MFEVGKKYIYPMSNQIYICLFLNGDGGLFQKDDKHHPFWWDKIINSNLVPYTPPPKKIKKEGWINIYRGDWSYLIYPTEQSAKSDKSLSYTNDYITTIKIEWEEEEKE